MKNRRRTSKSRKKGGNGFVWKCVNPDGSPKTCKVCGEPVWYNALEGRWYDAGGRRIHKDTCGKPKNQPAPELEARVNREHLGTIFVENHKDSLDNEIGNP